MYKSKQQIIKEYFREMQKKSSAKRLLNDPKTYKKMSAQRRKIDPNELVDATLK